MENLKGCLDCKHYDGNKLYGLCEHPQIVRTYNYFQHANGRMKTWRGIEEASDARSSSGKCKREAIYFEPTRYYKFKQWLKQLLK